MKINCTQQELVKAITYVSSVTEKKTTMPILGNVLLETKGDQLIITGTDLEISIQCSIKAQILKEGKICTPALQLSDIIKRLPKSEVVLQKDEQGWLMVNSGKAQFRVACVDAQEFPKIPSIQDFKMKQVLKETLKTGIYRTAFAMSSDEMRPNLNGILFQIEDGFLKMVATDGHRLSLVEHKLQKNETIELHKKIILPRKGINELKTILSETGNDQIEVGFSETQAVFVVSNSQIFMKQVVGDFPDYKMVLPKGDRKKLIVDRDMFSDSLKRVSLLSDGKSKCVKLGIKSNAVHMSANSPELGEAQEELSSEFEGKEFQIGFNAKYLLDTLSVLDNGKIVFELDHEQSPGVFKLMNDTTYCGVIMPMRI